MRHAPHHPVSQVQSFAEWLDDHGWRYRATHTWVWPPSGETMNLAHTLGPSTPWVIAATATALKIMAQPQTKSKRHRPKLRSGNTR